MMEIDLERVQKEGTPLVDGNTVTFIWLGSQAPRLVGDFVGWREDAALQMVEQEPGVWTYTDILPVDAYIEYAFLMHDKRVLDPLNKATISEDPGSLRNYFYMPEGEVTSLTERRFGISWGCISQYFVETNGWVTGEKRPLTLYRPPDIEAPYPLLVVFDGKAYLQDVRLPQMLANLMAEKRIAPLGLALVPSWEEARVHEYACNENTLRFVSDCVLPFAQRELNLIDVQANPGAYGVLGASMGGLMALYAGLRFPHIFGHVLTQSGAFRLNGYGKAVFDLIQEYQGQFPDIWMDVGKFDILLDANRCLRALLVEKGCAIAYREYNAGHNYPAWRNDIYHGLEAMFPAQL